MGVPEGVAQYGPIAPTSPGSTYRQSRNRCGPGVSRNSSPSIHGVPARRATALAFVPSVIRSFIPASSSSCPAASMAWLRGGGKPSGVA